MRRRNYKFDLGVRRSGIFFTRGLDRFSRATVFLPVGQIRCAGWAEPFAESCDLRRLIAIVLALTSLSASSKRVREQGVAGTEIRVGNVMPYSGSLEVFGGIGKAEAAYFEMINERGGINGRKVRFISHDDKSDPSA